MDSKYANLPGIARNEPDCYETSEITIIEQAPIEDDSNNVQKIYINTKEAFEKFNKTDLNGQYVDFSDTITSRRKFGYLVDKDSYEWDAVTKESPLQKFNRLQREMDELKNDLKQIQAENDDENKTKLNLDFDPLSLSKQVENLRKQATNLHLEVIGANTDAKKLDGKVKKQLLIDHFNDLKKSLNATSESAKTAPSSSVAKTPEHDSSIVFKLFNDLDSSNLNKTTKVSDLSQRLSRLELILGSNDKLVNSLCSNIDNKSLLGLVEHLNTKVSLVDVQSIENIESRLHWITQKVTQLNEKKSVIEDQEKLNKISELYTMINKWKDLSLNIPNIVSRLSALNDLHQQAFQFSSALTRLDSEQQSMKQTLDTNSDILKQLKTNLDKNLESIKNNFDTLNTRILSINTQTNA